MSLLIPCPHCGQRSIEEWVHGELFPPPEAVTDADLLDLDRAYMHDNRAGIVREAWFHAFGCRRWVYLHRDTETDQVIEP